MSRNRRIFTLGTLCLFLTASTVMAGGGTKRDPQIKVRNNGSTAVGVAVGLTDDQLIAINNSGDPEGAFTSAGGQIINSRAEATFDAQEGDNRVVVIKAQGSGQSFVVTDDEDIAVGRGQTMHISVDENGQIQE